MLTALAGGVSTGLGAGLLVEVLPCGVTVSGLGLGKAETLPVALETLPRSLMSDSAAMLAASPVTASIAVTSFETIFSAVRFSSTF